MLCYGKQYHLLQVRQAPDAPMLPPRDLSAPPLPPRRDASGLPIVSGTMPRNLPSQSHDLSGTTNHSVPLIRRNSALDMHLISSQSLLPSCCTSGSMGTTAPPPRRHMSVNGPILTASSSCFPHSSGKISSSSSVGPVANATDVLQPIGLLHSPYPSILFGCSHVCRQVPPRPRHKRS